MKKLLALALALVLILALVPAAHADLVDTAMKMLVKQSNEQTGENGTYSYVRHGNLIIYKFVGEYFDELYAMALEDEDMKEIYDGIAEALAEEQANVQEALDGYSSVVFVDCVVSAKDPTVVYLAAANGEIIIDLLNGISIFAE